MVEAGAKEVTEAQVVGALEAAHAAIKQIVAGHRRAEGRRRQEEARGRRRRRSRREFHREVEKQGARPARPTRCASSGKLESYAQVDEVLADLLASLPEGDAQQKKRRRAHLPRAPGEGDEATRRSSSGVRLDGRKFDEIRPIWTETGVLPRVHGSVVFTRGETQALVTCTLGTADDEQKIEHVTGEFYKRFMLHYNFPPFSVGETGRFSAARAAARSATARWPSARWRRSIPAKTSSPTPSASSPTSSSRTARRRWRRCAAARWR